MTSDTTSNQARPGVLGIRYSVFGITILVSYGEKIGYIGIPVAPWLSLTDPNLDQVKHLGFHITNQKIPRIVPGHLGMD